MRRGRVALYVLALICELALLALTAADAAQLSSSDTMNKGKSDTITFLALSGAATCLSFVGNVFGAKYILQQLRRALRVVPSGSAVHLGVHSAPSQSRLQRL